MNKRSIAHFLSLFVLLSVQVFGGNYVTICEIKDQFGGQLFITAMAYGIAWDNGLDVAIPGEIYLHALNGRFNFNAFFHHIANPAASEILQTPPEHISHSGAAPYRYGGGDICIAKVQLEPGYFNHHREKIRDLFAIPEPIQKAIEQKYGPLLDHPKTVAVHVRTYHPLRCPVHGFLGSEYFKAAMNRFSDDHLFVVFSDRIEWCKKHFAHFKPNMIFIEGNDHVTDLFFMSLCKNFVISNSTFGWWAAYLRKSATGRVVAPSKWYFTQDERNDMAQRGWYPSEWEVAPVDHFAPPDFELLLYPTTSAAEAGR